MDSFLLDMGLRGVPAVHHRINPVPVPTEEKGRPLRERHPPDKEGLLASSPAGSSNRVLPVVYRRSVPLGKADIRG